jgi:hypothetical protein
MSKPLRNWTTRDPRSEAERYNITPLQREAILGAKRELPHGVYKGLVSRGFMRNTSIGYQLTADGVLARVKVLERRQRGL